MYLQSVLVDEEIAAVTMGDAGKTSRRSAEEKERSG